MNSKPIVVILSVIFVALIVGCDSLLLKPAPAANPLVQTFGVNTNEPALVAYLDAADKLNTAVNVTATEAPIHMLLAGLTTIAAAAAGWYARHKMSGNNSDPPKTS